MLDLEAVEKRRTLAFEWGTSSISSAFLGASSFVGKVVANRLLIQIESICSRCFAMRIENVLLRCHEHTLAEEGLVDLLAVGLRNQHLESLSVGMLCGDVWCCRKKSGSVKSSESWEKRKGKKK